MDSGRGTPQSGPSLGQPLAPSEKENENQEPGGGLPAGGVGPDSTFVLSQLSSPLSQLKKPPMTKAISYGNFPYEPNKAALIKQRASPTTTGLQSAGVGFLGDVDGQSTVHSSKFLPRSHSIEDLAEHQPGQAGQAGQCSVQ